MSNSIRNSISNNTRKHLGKRLGVCLGMVLLSTSMLTACSLPILNSEAKESEEKNSENTSTEELVRHSSQPGYHFMADGVNQKVEFTVDEEAEAVVDLLPAPDNFFEAPSCTGEGVERIYSYNHYVINTYPKGDEDYIASIVLMDDMVETEEGATIGMSLEEIQGIYGRSDRKDGDMLLYPKDNMRLGIIMTNGHVSSIQYITQNYVKNQDE